MEGWKSLRERAGAFMGLTVLHRVPHELEGSQETHIFVLANFEKARQVIRLIRDKSGRYLLDSVNMPDKAVIPLAPLSSEEFAGWNFRLLMGPHLRLRAEANLAAWLEIMNSGGKVSAKRLL